MGADSHHPTLDARTLRLIHRKARQLVGKYGFTQNDLEDIEGDLRLEMLIRLSSYGFSSFVPEHHVARHLDQAAARLIAHRRAAKRDCPFDLCSLYEVATDLEGEEVLQVEIAREEAMRSQHGLTSHSAEEEIVFLAALERAMALMRPELREVCVQILRLGPNKERLAAALGISRQTLYERLREIRRVLERVGLGRYP